MSDLLQRVEGEIMNRRLLRRGDKILVGVSGGVDSMILLRVLKILSAKHKWSITVAHFNHQLRGRAAAADEQFVRKTAARVKVPIVVGSEDVRRFAEVSKLSIEMAGRRLRHGFFARVAKERKIHSVALAHHADDQVELFFLRLLRGAGSEGLAGMKWRAPSPVDKNVALIRPLLDLTKRELLKFAHANKIRFREDATNADLNLLRNRIRGELLPLLRKNYQPGLTKNVLRVMQIIGAESDFVGEAARQWTCGSGRQSASFKSQSRLTSAATIKEIAFEGLPIALQRRVLQSQLIDLGVAASFDQIEWLRQSPNQFLSVGPEISLARDARGEIQLRLDSKAGFMAGKQVVKLADRAGEVIFGGRKFKWKLDEEVGRRKLEMKTGRELFDADKTGRKIVLRHWRPGDRFQPIGLKSAAKLQDLFTNAKIPRERRHQLVVAEAANGEIFWVEGLRISEAFKWSAQTRRRLLWSCS